MKLRSVYSNGAGLFRRSPGSWRDCEASLCNTSVRSRRCVKLTGNVLRKCALGEIFGSRTAWRRVARHFTRQLLSEAGPCTARPPVKLQRIQPGEKVRILFPWRRFGLAANSGPLVPAPSSSSAGSPEHIDRLCPCGSMCFVAFGLAPRGGRIRSLTRGTGLYELLYELFWEAMRSGSELDCYTSSVFKDFHFSVRTASPWNSAVNRRVVGSNPT